MLKHKLLIVGVALLLTGATTAAQTCHGPGKARWPIKTSLPQGTSANGSGKAIPLDKLLALEPAPGVKDDAARYLGISNSTDDPITTSPATIASNAGCLPFSESTNNPTGIGPTEDDVSMLWLNQSCTTSDVVGMLETQSPANNNIAGLGEIFWGAAITQLFNPGGLAAGDDSRAPDILVTPNIGVTYSGSTKKLAEHGGFSHDDTNVMMLVSNPSLTSTTITTPVETEQIAPTILQVLGLSPQSLQAVQIEGTQVLPGL